MRDPVTYVRLALPRAIIGQMALGFTEHESEAAQTKAFQVRINPNPYQREHANSLRYQNSNMTPRL